MRRAAHPPTQPFPDAVATIHARQRSGRRWFGCRRCRPLPTRRRRAEHSRPPSRAAVTPAPPPALFPPSRAGHCWRGDGRACGASPVPALGAAAALPQPLPWPGGAAPHRAGGGRRRDGRRPAWLRAWLSGATGAGGDGTTVAGDGMAMHSAAGLGMPEQGDLRGGWAAKPLRCAPITLGVCLERSTPGHSMASSHIPRAPCSSRYAIKTSEHNTYATASQVDGVPPTNVPRCPVALARQRRHRWAARQCPSATAGSLSVEAADAPASSPSRSAPLRR